MYDLIPYEQGLPSYISEIIDLSDGLMTRARIKFTNGYQLSIIRGEYSYGGSMGLFEIAVFDKNGEFATRKILGESEDNFWGDDVLGYKRVEDLKEWIEKVGNYVEKIENNSLLLL